MAAVEVMLLAGADPVAVAAASETVIAWAHARQLEAMDQVACEQPALLDPTGRLVDPAPAEIATSLHWSTGAATARVDLAQQLCGQLPGVLAGLREGRHRSAQGPGDRLRHLRTGPGGAGAAGRTRGRLRRRAYPRPAAGLADPPGRRDRPRGGAAPTQESGPGPAGVDHPGHRRHGHPRRLPERRGSAGLLERAGRRRREHRRRHRPGPRRPARGTPHRPGTRTTRPGAGTAHPRRPGTGRPRPAQPPPHRRTVPARPADRPHRGPGLPRLPARTRPWPAGSVPATGTAASPAAAARRCNAIWTM